MSKLFPKKPTWVDAIKVRFSRLEELDDEQAFHLFGALGFVLSFGVMVFGFVEPISLAFIFQAMLVSAIIAYPVAILSAVFLLVVFGIPIYIFEQVKKISGFIQSFAQEKKRLNERWEHECRQIEKRVEREYQQAIKSNKKEHSSCDDFY